MKKIFFFLGFYLFTVISFAQSGKFDFTPELGDGEYVPSGSGNAIYLLGAIYVLLIIFGHKELRQVLLGIALAFIGFIAYAYALREIGIALQVCMLGDTPNNRKGMGMGLLTFVIGYFSPIYFYSKRKLDGTSNKVNNLILGTIFFTVLISFFFSYFYLLSSH